MSYSEDFSQSYWTKTDSNVTSNSVISPDGTLNADKLVENTQNTAHIAFASPTITLGNNTFSVFAKAAERRVLGIEFPSNGILVSFDLIDGVFVNQQANPDNFSITPFLNGWYRIDITENLTSNSVVALSLRDENGNRTYQGDGTSGVYIWGAMLEQGSYSTSYIPTNGEANGVTRAAETANGSGDAATFSGSEGVLMAEISALANDGTTRRLSISDGGYSNRITLELDESSNTLRVFVISASTTYYSPSEVLSDITNYNKVAIKYKQNDFALWINGFEFDVDNSGDTPINLSQMQFADGNGSDAPFLGKTKQIQYYNSALTDSELEQLTSWTSFSDMANGQLYTIE